MGGVGNTAATGGRGSGSRGKAKTNVKGKPEAGVKEHTAEPPAINRPPQLGEVLEDAPVNSASPKPFQIPRLSEEGMNKRQGEQEEKAEAKEKAVRAPKSKGRRNRRKRRSSDSSLPKLHTIMIVPTDSKPCTAEERSMLVSFISEVCCDKGIVCCAQHETATYLSLSLRDKTGGEVINQKLREQEIGERLYQVRTRKNYNSDLSGQNCGVGRSKNNNHV